jgi:hypothetical protein
MARGDLKLFNDFAYQIGSGYHNFAEDTIKLGLVTNGVTPTIADSDPVWGDYSGSEVGTGGNYTANGETLANITWNLAGRSGIFDADNVSFAQNAGGFTNAYWGIFYNDTHVADAAFAFLDMNGPVSEVDGPVNINFSGSGIFATVIPGN